MTLDVQHTLDRFDTCVASLRDKHDPQGPGFSIALTLNGQAIRTACHGQALTDWPQPLTGDTRLYLASESKFWVAALVMDAVAAGRVALDADVRPALPALADCTQPVRLGHLLRHTSGVDDYLYLWHLQLGHDEDDLVTQEQALALIRRAGDLDFEPGTRHDYSNSNYVLLADWLERDTGRPLSEIARDRFFAPWGLSNTSFERDPRRVLSRRARSYQRAASGDWRELPVNLATWGDGGMWSTLDDLVCAEANLLDDWRRHGTNAVLARCSGDDPRFGPADLPYAFGIESMAHDHRRLLFHGGGFAGFSSLVLRSIEDGLSLIVLANVEGFDASAKTWAERLWPTAG
ncbi:serine hydrolase domain-containing protein [Aquabacterium sp. OR-4]|uniref:serine hydrolase domain-containing protein n=1 Tax=Aquabacterium sp. OR-4 TaxID=2978127 RepID=UPI0028C5A78A|nr:serine hydrolase domain-containing protein [Aquabacterium sp. OR-4]MDT7837206.1 serine hydrolase domain-containing protein [Aquabacterium sp. OR-4]